MIRFTYRKDIDTVQECFKNGCNIFSEHFSQLTERECKYVQNTFYRWIEECVALHTHTSINSLDNVKNNWCEYFITLRFPSSQNILEYKGIFYVTMMEKNE
jgi:hypothetical protein